MIKNIQECISILDTYKSLNNKKTLSIQEESTILKEYKFSEKTIKEYISYIYKKDSNTPKLNRFIEQKPLSKNIKLEENIQNLTTFINSTVIPQSTKKMLEANDNLIFIMNMDNNLKKVIQDRINMIANISKLIPAFFILGLSSFLAIKNESQEEDKEIEELQTQEKEEKELPITKPLPQEQQKEKYIKYREQEEQTSLEDINEIPDNFKELESIFQNVINKYNDFLKIVNISIEEFKSKMPELEEISSTTTKNVSDVKNKLSANKSKITGLINFLTSEIKKSNKE